MGRVVSKFSFMFQILLHLKEHLINLNNPCPAEPRPSFSEITVDPDQLASTKPSDQDSRCFPP